ncbi:hypothetical protein KCV87_13505 [Actinosynnema pretiosum subsp. pretiosum]|uniref:Uncharacterized protein n=1 Tax=Actinosynnema pretiosum subsp. pretiosum TaxID=103721 RepID=A0AA45LBS7_9PSEU|nr:hypothetical protein [Actinosynnema mirum]QUF06966.1 hypothetical protein KCV87_13505 [Actinosynnema pretiosum subsp. pretiosum]
MADAKLVEELRLLLDAAAERAEPWLHRVAAAEDGHDPAACGWCPLCNAVALARGDRSQLASKAAEHVAGLIAVLRTALAEADAKAARGGAAAGSAGGPFGAGPDPAGPDGAGPAEERVARPRVQRIPVVRKPC